VLSLPKKYGRDEHDHDQHDAGAERGNLEHDVVQQFRAPRFEPAQGGFVK
jgi:hypothetical protein